MRMAGPCLGHALVAVVALAAPLSVARGAEKDIPGWEAARWGMSEADLRRAFGSKLLLEKRAEEPSAKAFGMPGYVFLGCPFDVTFHISQARGLVRVELIQVERLLGHGSGGRAADYEKACALIDQKLEETYGPATQERRYEKDWTFPSAEITTGGARAGQVYIDYRARADSKRA
jgi:hypothetical protein